MTGDSHEGKVSKSKKLVSPVSILQSESSFASTKIPSMLFEKDAVIGGVSRTCACKNGKMKCKKIISDWLFCSPSELNTMLFTVRKRQMQVHYFDKIGYQGLLLERKNNLIAAVTLYLRTKLSQFRALDEVLLFRL